MTVDHRVTKLEHAHGIQGPCPLCHGRGRWVLTRPGAEPPPGCPGCGRRNVLVNDLYDLVMPRDKPPAAAEGTG